MIDSRVSLLEKVSALVLISTNFECFYT